MNSELAINLGLAIDRSTHESYTSALNSYITFCHLHGFDIEPTQRTLAYYVTFQSSYINPKSINSYLSGICNQLESHFPDVQNVRRSPMVSQALKGAKRRFGRATTCKLPLTGDNLDTVFNTLGANPSHNDVLFAAQLFTGFENLLRLSKLCWPDKVALRDYHKVTMRHTVEKFDNYFGLFLPAHKSDALFEGNRLIIRRTSMKAFDLFTQYLTSWDQNSEHVLNFGCTVTGSSPLAPGSCLDYVRSSLNQLVVNPCVLVYKLREGGPRIPSTVHTKEHFSI